LWYANSRFLKLARPAADGGFDVTDLPDGDYYATALAALRGAGADGNWQDPEFLKTLVGNATRVSIADGGSTRLTLSLTSR
jgi:hypothetical protein